MKNIVSNPIASTKKVQNFVKYKMNAKIVASNFAKSVHNVEHIRGIKICSFTCLRKQ